MKIVSWNVNGIRSVYKKGFIEWLEKSNIDILGIQETKAHPDQLTFDLKMIPNYESYFSSAEKKGYAGTAIYSKPKPKNIITDINHPIIKSQGRLVRADYKNFSVLNFYITNGGRNKERLDEKLELYNFLFDYFKKELKKQPNLVIMGDFNIAHTELDLARPGPNKNSIMFTPKEREQLDILTNMGFVDTFRIFNKEGGFYSWWAYFAQARERNIGWRIDYVFVSKKLEKKVKNAFILKEVEGSDHCPVGIELDML